MRVIVDKGNWQSSQGENVVRKATLSERLRGIYRYHGHLLHEGVWE